MIKKFLGILTMSVCWGVSAQDIELSSHWLQDSFLLGEPIQLELTLKYPRGEEVLLSPNQNKLFPFEFIEAHSFGSKRVENRRVETYVFHLRSFEIFPEQAAQVIYAHIIDTDTNYFVHQTEHIIWQSVIEGNIEDASYKSHTGVLHIEPPPNYLAWALIAIFVAMLSILFFRLFKFPVLRWWQTRKLRRQWRSARAELLHLQANAAQQAQVLEDLAELWKSYLDPQNVHYLRSKTTTELQEAVHILEEISPAKKGLLLKSSQMMDQVIYAEQLLPTQEIRKLIEQFESLFLQVYQYRKDAIQKEEPSY